MPTATAKRSAKPPRQTSTGVIVVIVVAVVAVAAIVVGVATQLGKKSSTSGLSQTQPVTVTGTSLPQLPDPGTTDSAIGTTPPTLTGKSFDGTPIVIDPADGKPKLVVFGAHWCPHCQAEFPRLVQWQAAGDIPAGVEVYAVATGTSSAQANYPPSSWLQRVGWTNPTMADSQDYKAANAWGLVAYPYFVAIDSSGKVAARTSGELTEDQFKALLAQIAPS